jgi:hypothetical protein
LVVEKVPPPFGVNSLRKFFIVNEAVAVPIVKIPASRSVVYDSKYEVRSTVLPVANLTDKVVV